MTPEKLQLLQFYSPNYEIRMKFQYSLINITMAPPLGRSDRSKQIPKVSVERKEEMNSLYNLKMIDI